MSYVFLDLMLNFIESKIKYTFREKQYVELAFKAAHRDRYDGTHDDGNRGLAYFGTIAISMVKTHNVIVESGKTLHDLNTLQHWTNSKKGRATACRSLGLEPFITQSIRQQCQPPSETVLDNALSALFAAVWLDCKDQEKTTAATYRILWGVLRNIDAVLDNSSPTPLPTTSEEDTQTSMGHDTNTMFDHYIEPLDTTELDLGGELEDLQRSTNDWFEQELGNINQEQLSYDHFVSEAQGLPFGTSVNAESTLLPNDRLVGDLSDFSVTLCAPDSVACANLGPVLMRSRNMSQDSIHGRSICSSSEASQIADSNATTPTTRAKRKRTQNNRDKVNPTYRNMLGFEQHKLGLVSPDEKERLTWFLEHPLISESENNSAISLPFFYLAVGSLQTVNNFKSQLRLARSTTGIYQPLSTSGWSAAETYNEICRLEREEALSVLMRRYHTIKLCENERNLHFHHRQIIFETPCTIVTGGKSNAGNPLLAQEARLTDELLYKIMPEIQPGSEEFKKARRRVQRLRKLARYLNVLVESYGLGILALLPSGPSFGELSLTDNMLLSMTEANFNYFARLLFQKQGSLLKGLSKSFELPLKALVTFSLRSDPFYPIEHMELSHLESVPKGLLDSSQYSLVIGHHA